MIWSQWRNKLFLKQHLAISLVGRRILSLYVRIFVPLTTNSSFLILFVMLKIQVQRLNLQVKNCLHQSLWRLLRLINWQMNKVKWRLRVVCMSLGPSIQPALTLLSIFQKLQKPFKGHLTGSNFTLVRMTVSTATSWTV